MLYSQATPVKCDVCNLTVSCQKTYESHIAGKPHRKRAAQTEKIKQLQQKMEAQKEQAINSVPGGIKPGNPLQSRDNGDIHCTVSDRNTTIFLLSTFIFYCSKTNISMSLTCFVINNALVSERYSKIVRCRYLV